MVPSWVRWYIIDEDEDVLTFTHFKELHLVFITKHVYIQETCVLIYVMTSFSRAIRFHLLYARCMAVCPVLFPRYVH